VAADSDFLVICSQLTDETRRFISAPVFAVMKPAAAAGAHPATADPADTAHLGSGDTNMAEPLRRLFADNLRRYLDGQPLRNEVDRTRG